MYCVKQNSVHGISVIYMSAIWPTRNERQDFFEKIPNIAKHTPDCDNAGQKGIRNIFSLPCCFLPTVCHLGSRYTLFLCAISHLLQVPHKPSHVRFTETSSCALNWYLRHFAGSATSLSHLS